MKLTLELQLLAAALLQQLQQQQQQQPADKAARLLKTCNKLLVLQLFACAALQRPYTADGHVPVRLFHYSCFFLLVTRGGVTLLAGHTHQPDESDCGGLQHCCH
jgi:hypothetical protein